MGVFEKENLHKLTCGNGSVSIKEIEFIIKTLPTAKTNPDYFTVEFYEAFKNNVKSILQLPQQIEKGILSNSFYEFSTNLTQHLKKAFQKKKITNQCTL